MKPNFKILTTGILVLFLLSVLCGTGLAAEAAMLKGKVIEGSKLSTEEGQVYDVADTESGKDLLQNTGKMVEVKGYVVEKEGQKVIEVESFTVIE